MTAHTWSATFNNAFGNWSDSTNWSPSGAPSAADVAFLSLPRGSNPYTVTFDTTPTIAGLQVYTANATLQWDTAAARALTVTGATMLGAGTIDLATTSQAGSSLETATPTVTGGTFLSDTPSLSTGWWPSRAAASPRPLLPAECSTPAR